MKHTTIDLQCPTVADWLKRHQVTRCPTGHALGLSAMEKQFGIAAGNSQGWMEQIKQRQSNEVLAAKQKVLRSGEKSGK